MPVHPGQPCLQKLVNAIQSAWPSPKTKFAPPKCLVTTSYLPLVALKLSSGSSQNKIVLIGLVIWLRRNPRFVFPERCVQRFIEYMKYGFESAGCTVRLVLLGQDQMPFVSGVGGVPAMYN
jgi:hypothetical protein